MIEDMENGPDHKLSDMLTILKTNRLDIIGQLADYHRTDGILHRELLLSLTICQTAITAIEAEVGQW